MKKTIFTLMLLAVMGIMSAQSLQFEREGTVYQDGQELICEYDEVACEYNLHVQIRNISGEALDVMVEQMVAETADGALVYLCWDQCLAPGYQLLGGPVNIPANTLSEEDCSFHIMFTEGETGIVRVKYTAFNRANIDDKVCLTVLAGTAAETAEHTVSLGQAYPNPASTQVHFNYNCDGSSNVNAVVYNLLGQEVKVQPINNSHGRIDIAVDDLQPGIYFCSIQVNNATVKTEKFIVKR